MRKPLISLVTNVINQIEYTTYEINSRKSQFPLRHCVSRIFNLPKIAILIGNFCQRGVERTFFHETDTAHFRQA